MNFLLLENKIDYIFSEDSDIAVYGCKNIVKGFRKNGQCYVLDEEIIENFRNKVNKKGKEIKNFRKGRKALQFLDLTPSQKVSFGILCGCDYIENLKGLGFGTIIEYFSRNSKEYLHFIETYLKDKKLVQYPR